MEENKTPSTSKKEVDNTGNYVFVSAILGAAFYFKRKRFIDFINSIKFSMVVKSVENNRAVVNIMPLQSLDMPYSIKSIDLIHNEKMLAATNSSCDLRSRIVSLSRINIVFNTLEKDVTKEILEECQIAITYKFFGFSCRRLYTPLNFLNNEATIVDVPVSSCGCSK